MFLFIKLIVIYIFFQGLSKSERSKDTVKLHMTLINTKYAMDKKKRFVRVDPFDATGVMEVSFFFTDNFTQFFASCVSRLK